MSLMSNFSVNIKKIEEKFKIDFFSHFKTELEELKKLDEFVEISSARIDVTPTGTLLIRNIAMCFDQYMIRQSGKNSFSKTV